eukprot:768373-Hanusia_phi.AAC.18
MAARLSGGLLLGGPLGCLRGGLPGGLLAGRLLGLPCGALGRGQLGDNLAFGKETLSSQACGQLRAGHCMDARWPGGPV